MRPFAGTPLSLTRCLTTRTCAVAVGGNVTGSEFTKATCRVTLSKSGRCFWGCHPPADQSHPARCLNGVETAVVQGRYNQLTTSIRDGYRLRMEPLKWCVSRGSALAKVAAQLG